jgi:putative ABC transport system permease protein
MFWSGSIKSAIASMRTSKWRSMLTMMGVVVGITSVITIVSLGEGLKHQISSQIDQLGSSVLTVRSGKLVNRNQSGGISNVNLLAFLSTSTLTNEDVESVSKLSSVDAVVPIDFVTSSAKSDNTSSDNLFVVGTSPQMVDVLHQKVNYGAFFDQDGPDQNVAVIGSNVAHQLFQELNPVGQTIHIQGQNFIVRGILAQTSGGLLSVAQTDYNSAVFIPSKAALILTNDHTNILQILARSKAKDLEQTQNEIHSALIKNHEGQEDFTVLKQYELLNIASSTVNIITNFISAIAAISLLVGGIGIMDIMLVSVSERTREIGVRKAIGATNRQILAQFLLEGSALSITGGIIGIGVSFAINQLLRLYTNLGPVITLPTVILAFTVSVAIGIIFSVAPALKASRKHPIDALRGE